MPEVSDPMASIGYLIAAGAATVIGLVGYCLMLVQWSHEADARTERLRSETSSQESSPPRETPVP